MELLEITFKDLLNPEFYIVNGGLWLFLFIVFAETGLFAGFFLPGDSLLFVAGIYSNELVTKGLGFNTNNDLVHLLLLSVMVIVAGVVGNTVGYWFGQKGGPALYKRKDSFFFKKKYLEQAHDFYEKNGGGAIIIARFVPFVRTFAPIVAGIVQMDRQKFAFYNIIGCMLWVGSMLVSGHFLQTWIYKQFDFDLKEHLEVIVIGIVAITTFPVIWKIFLSKKNTADAPAKK
jgi:membrane-associated protein